VSFAVELTTSAALLSSRNRPVHQAIGVPDEGGEEEAENTVKHTRSQSEPRGGRMAAKAVSAPAMGTKCEALFDFPGASAEVG
jgi:hypothetical protein